MLRVKFFRWLLAHLALTVAVTAQPAKTIPNEALQLQTAAGSSAMYQPKASELDAESSQFEFTEGGLPIFGSQLFQGDFGDLSFGGFNPDYQIGLGDQIQVLIWGALTQDLDLKVDAQGNLFLPSVGPVKVQGVRNADLNSVIQQQIEQVYKENVDSYASLSSTQTVKVFVSGFVNQPGLYQGFASDSVLYYLDRAGGIDAQRGSYLQVNLVRSDQVIRVINLYDFLSSGRMPLTQFQDGDVILVKARGHTVECSGDLINPGRFEFGSQRNDLMSLLSLASPKPDATSVSIRRKQDGQSRVHVLDLAEQPVFELLPGDEIKVTSREVAGNLLVSFSGEHAGVERKVFPLGTTLADVIQAIQPTELSHLAAVQLFRRSLAERQRELIDQSLDNLERQVMTASSVSLEEAQLRQVEAETILSFIHRARQVKPTGQIVINSLAEAKKLHIQDGDAIHVPRKSNLVLVHGEINYPNTQIFNAKDSVQSYIKRAGGFSENANKKELVLIKANGLVRSIGSGRFYDLEPGDEIIVLAAPDSKKLMFAKEISTIMYQIALGARVVVGL
jgi:protein involved in polysaccharide export with SLBB domain